ncbi:hypothetical protein ACFQZC_26755 [Streptacidiphilus monticola]
MTGLVFGAMGVSCAVTGTLVPGPSPAWARPASWPPACCCRPSSPRRC